MNKTIKKVKPLQNSNEEFKITGFFPNGQGGDHDRFRVEVCGKQAVFEEPVFKALFQEPFEIEFDEHGEQVGEHFRRVTKDGKLVKKALQPEPQEEVGETASEISLKSIESMKKEVIKKLTEKEFKFNDKAGIETLLKKLEE